MTATQPVYVPSPDDSNAAPEQRKPKRAWWKTTAAGALVFVVGAGVGAAGASNEEELAATKSHASRAAAQASSEIETLEADLAAAQQANGSMAEQLDDAENRADSAVDRARAAVKKEFASRGAQLDAREARLNATGRALDKREREVSGMERAWAANTIPGDGIFIVGQDVDPGLYKASASAGCYFARLKEGDGLDNIIDNNNVDGPVAFTIASSDYAVETSGCADFHKVG